MGSSKVLRFAQANTVLCAHTDILFSLLFIWRSCCAEAQAVLQKALLRDNCARMGSTFGRSSMHGRKDYTGDKRVVWGWQFLTPSL